MGCNIARALFALATAAATVVPAGTAFAQASVPAATSAPHPAGLHLAGPPPGPPPDCKHHPTFPGCKKK